MPHVEDVQERQQGTPNTREANEGGIRWLRIATVVVCLSNLAYVVAAAVLIGILKGWVYSIHCLILCLLILLTTVQAVKAKTKLMVKCACWESYSTLALVLMTTFTLLIRQAFYHPSPHIEPNLVLFSVQASIIPLVGGILVMYECSIKKLYEDRFILMVAVLDFADIWDMVSILSQDKAPFIKEESSLEITMQFFCSFSFSIFSVLIYKNIAQEGLKYIFNTNDPQQPASEEDKENHDLLQNLLTPFCSAVAISNSQLFQNIPFLIIRILLLVNYDYLDFEYLAKNVILVIFSFLDCYDWKRQNESVE